jgi:type I restriction enzyme S subunit
VSKLPNNWTNTNLKTVANIVTGNTPSTKSPEYYGGNVPFVKPGDLDSAAPIISTEQQLTELGAKESRLVRAGSILVSCIGNLGKVGFAGVSLATNQQINSAEFYSGIVDDRYGYYLCKTLKPWMERESSATTIAILNKGKFGEAPVPLAPLDEQTRIADKLDTVLSRVDAVNARLARVAPLLKRFRQSVLAAATSGRLTEDWRSELGLTYPWKQVKLSDIAIIQGGITKDSKKQSSSDEEIPYLRVANVQRGHLDLSEIKTIRIPKSQLDTLLLESGDILFNEGGDLDKLGRGWIWEGQIERCSYQNHVFRARLRDSEIQPKYISWWGNSQGLSYFIGEGKQTTNLASINKTKLSNLPIHLPSSEEQTEIVRRVETLFAFADRLEARLKAAQTAAQRLTPAVLAKAFRGELVPQDPADEPAAELLKRLAAQRADNAGGARQRGRPARV